MRHYTALQKGTDGPWHYVSASREGAYPVGYCAEYCQHTSAAEAFEHYRQYLLDTAQFGGETPDEMRRCEVCDAWTSLVVNYDHGWHSHRLCSLHNDRENLERIALPPGCHPESWKS